MAVSGPWVSTSGCDPCILQISHVHVHKPPYKYVHACNCSTHNAHTLPRATKYYKGQSSFHILRTEISPSNKRRCTEGLCRVPTNDATHAHIHVHVHARLYMYVHVTALATINNAYTIRGIKYSKGQIP